MKTCYYFSYICYSALLIALLASPAHAADVSFESRIKTHHLNEVSNQVVFGFFDRTASKTSAKNSLDFNMVPGLENVEEIAPGLYCANVVSKRAKRLHSLATNLPGCDFVYPLYRHADSGLLVYPRPEIIVRIQEDVDIETLAERYNLEVIRPLAYTSDQFVLRHDSSLSPFEMSDALRADPDIIWTAPNCAEESKPCFQPNDALYPQQWHLNNTGQDAGTSGADINAESAWDLVQPSTDLVIAIVDSGIDKNHPDLNLWVNEAEANGEAGVDDDGNGYIDDINGWNFETNDNQPYPTEDDIYEGMGDHGTPCAGAAAAIGNNEIGVVGSAPGVKVLAVKNMNCEDTALFVDSLRYTAMHSDISNHSYGREINDAYYEALTFATTNGGKRGDKGGLFLFATGNENWGDITSFTFKKELSLTPGSHQIVFQYDKDESGSAGEDQVQISDAMISMPTMGSVVSFPFSGQCEYMDIITTLSLSPGPHTLVFEYAKNDSISSGSDQIKISYCEISETDDYDNCYYFETYDASWPEDVRTEGDSPFFILGSEDRWESYLVSGPIGDNQTSRLIWDVTIEAEDTAVYEMCLGFVADTEPNNDLFHIYVDGDELVRDFENDDADEDFIFIYPYKGEFPDGVYGSGDQPFTLTSDDEPGYYYLSGAIGDNETSQLIWDFDIDGNGARACDFSVTFLPSTETDKDVFRLFIDGVEITDTFTIGNDEFQFPISGSDFLFNPHPLWGVNLHPGIINIGATNYNDVKTAYSQWGPELHFMAPSNDAFCPGIVTTICTAYDPEGYTSNFGGTSAACPIACGVVAMVLSANPDLTKDQIMDVLGETSAKVGSHPYDENGFNQWYGYGRLDMYDAVKRALELRGESVPNWELY